MGYHVYILRLKDKKHYYVGSTAHLTERLQNHTGLSPKLGKVRKSKDWGSYATRTYGFSGRWYDVLNVYEFPTREEAYYHEHLLATCYRELYPDVPICSDYYSFGPYNDWYS